MAASNHPNLVVPQEVQAAPESAHPISDHTQTEDEHRGCPVIGSQLRRDHHVHPQVAQAVSVDLLNNHHKSGSPPDSATTLPALDFCSSFLQLRHRRLQDLGLKSQGLPVRFRDLSVYSSQLDHRLVKSLDASVWSTISSPFNLIRTLSTRILGSCSNGTNPAGQIPILTKLSGVIDQSQMCLVLGRPGSGVTSVLRTISINHDAFSKIDGHLDFGSFSAQNLRESGLRSQVVMVEESDDHFGSLTVQQTLGLAAKSKTPRTRPDGLDRQGWANAEVDHWAQSFNLSAETLKVSVGSECLRGISGGERKRMSVIEGLLTRCSVICLDNVTAGLDSFNSHHLVRSIREWCRIDKTCAVVGLRQASDSLYHLFDKVFLLYNGHQIYFGPTSDAVDYFTQLGFVRTPNQPITDFLCSVTDPSTRKIQPGFPARVPLRPLEFVKAYQQSTHFSNLETEIANYEVRHLSSSTSHHVLCSLRTEKDRSLKLDSLWTINYFRQILYLTARQYALIRADLRPYATKTLINILLSVIIGTLFYQLPPTTEYAFTRGSVLFLSVLFNGYLQLSELGNTLVGRPIVKRHQQFGFYSPSTLAVARTLCDLPLIAAQVSIFATITYVLAGLQKDLDRFLVYIVTVFVTAINLTAIFRLFASLSPSFDEAMRYCGIALNIFVIYGGFFIPTPSMTPWLKWIRYYIDPVSYAFQEVIVNEFHGMELQCSPDHIIPRGVGYNDSNYQTCSSPGSKPKSLVVLGDDYILSAYGYEHESLAKSLIIIVGLSIIFLALSMVFTELFSFTKLESVKVFKNTKQMRNRLRKMKAALIEQSVEVTTDQGLTIQDLEGNDCDLGNAGVGANNLTTTTQQRIEPISEEQPQQVLSDPTQFEAAVITFKDLKLWVNTAGDSRVLLNDLTGYVRPGECTALMGVSGSGKTTLLNALAGRATYAKSSGEILIDGRAPTSESYKAMGYVEQFDSHDPYSTVREALVFSALLRQPRSVPRWAKLADVDRVINLLGLQHLEDAIVGTSTAGLGLEDRKRLSIGVELVAKPRVLCLDEPISGMDSRSATHIIQLLKKLVVNTNLTVIVTVHQPSLEIFENFDKLILLEKGGRLAYFGKREEAVGYFESQHSIKCGSQINPAEYLIDVLSREHTKHKNSTEDLQSQCTTSSSVTPRDSRTDLDSQATRCGSVHKGSLKNIEWSQSERYCETVERITVINSDLSSLSHFNNDHERGGTIREETIELTKRISRHFWRDSSFSYTQLLTATTVSTLISFSFYQQASLITNMNSLKNQMFSVFLILFVPPVFMNQMIFKWFSLKVLFESRERDAGIYREISLIAGFLIAEVPYCMISGLIFWSIWFFGVGFPPEIEIVCFTFLAVELFFFFQITWAIWIAALAPTIGMVSNLLPFFLLSMEAFNGSLISYQQMPWYWRWVYWVSPFQWYVKAVLSTVLHGQQVKCGESEIVYFESPLMTSCTSYLEGFMKHNSGYLTKQLVEDDQKILCGYCKYKTGEEYLKTLNFGFDQRYRAIGIFGSYCLINLFFIFYFSGFNRMIKNKGFSLVAFCRRAIKI